MVSDLVMFVRGVEETSVFHVVVDAVTVLGRDVDRADACETSIVVVTFAIVLLFTDGDEEISDLDVVIGVEALLVEPGPGVLGTGSDSEVITGPDVLLLICEDEGTVNDVTVVGTEAVLKEVLYLELVSDVSGVVISVLNVLPPKVEEVLLLCGNVDVETNTVLAVPSDEDREVGPD